MDVNLLTLDPPQYTKSRERCLTFITAQASIFHEASLLDSDSFSGLASYLRLTHIGKDSVYRILSEFSDVSRSFFDLVELYTPMHNWTWNYLKFSIRPYIDYQIHALHGLCRIVLERIPLALNKHIHLSSQNQTILFSSIGLEFVDRCANVIARLSELSQTSQTWTFTPDRWDAENLEALQQKMSEELEFKSQKRLLLVSAEQGLFFKQWAMALREFALISDKYNADWGLSLTELPHALVKVMTIEYNSELLSFADVNFYDTNDLELFDLRHQELLQRLQRINHSLHTAILGMARGFTGITKVSSEASHTLNNDTERYLGRYLVSKGVEPGKAVAALDSLQKYLAMHQVKASALIEPELMKINGTLDKDFAAKLKQVEIHDPLSTQATTDKQHNATLQKHLLDRLHHLVPHALSLLIFCMQIGCGLKTFPKAELEDLRPEIAYRKGKPTAASTIDTKKDQAASPESVPPVRKNATKEP